MGLAALIGVVVWLSIGSSERSDTAKLPLSSLQNSEYISVLDWPPLTQTVEEPYSCLEAGLENERAGVTKRKLINDREYCVTSVVEGAAGSIYTQYAYATEINGKTVILTFSTRASQCANYEPEKQLLCEATQKEFNPEPFIDELVVQQERVGTQNLPEAAPREAELSGTYICLPHTDTSGPQTLECALGLHASDGSYYALDFSQNSNAQFELKTGDRFTSKGILTPVEMLSSDHWKKYPIKGIFTITGPIEKF